MQKSEIYIKSCDVIISIEIQKRSNNSSQQRSIYIKKTTIISFKSKITINIHHISISFFKNRDFSFESNEFNVTIYVHLLDTSTEIVLVKNNSEQIVKMSRNFCLSRIIKINYSNIYQVDEESVNLTKKNSKSTYKFF